MFNIYSYQMIGLADQNNRVYESKYGIYSKQNGFTLSKLSSSMTKEELLDNLLHEDCWSLKQDIKRMTKDEIEEKLGYKIEIVENEKQNDEECGCKEKDKNSNICKKNYEDDEDFINNYIKMLRKYYGRV